MDGPAGLAAPDVVTEAGADDLLRALGATLGPRGARQGVLHFGDASAEARLLAHESAFVPLLGLSAHEVRGADARSFLHRMLSQDVKGLVDGDGRPSFFLDVRGRVQGDPFVWALRDAFVLGEEPAAAARAIPSLTRFVIADDVAIEDVTAEWVQGWLVGPSAPAVVDAVRPLLARLSARAGQSGLGPVPGFRLLVPVTALHEVVSALSDAGAPLAGEEALDIARVETGTPWFGAEIDDRILPNEVGLDASISWTKGCYLGQEPVVMARHRGHPANLLVRCEIAGDDLPAPGSPLSAAGREVGRITTSVHGVERAGSFALALVRYEAAKVGAVLDLASRAGAARIDAVFAGKS